MKLRIQFTGQLRTALGRADDMVELPEGSNIASLLAHLAAASLDAAPHLVTAEGAPRPSLLVVVNGEAQAARDGSTELREGDDILLLPPIAGG